MTQEAVSNGTAAPLPTLEDLGMATDYLKIGDYLYAIKKIGAGIDVEKEVRQYYADRVKGLQLTMATAVSKEIQDDAQRQLDKIEKYRRKGAVAIPRELIDKPCVYTQRAGEVMEAVPIVYHPWLVVGSKGNFTDIGVSTRTKAWEGLKADDKVEVLIQNTVYIPALVGVARKTKRLYMFNMFTPHTFSDGRLCIGESPFEQYANLAPLAMAKQLSVINLFSPVNQYIRFDRTELPIGQFINEMCTILKVQKGVATAWKM